MCAYMYVCCVRQLNRGKRRHEYNEAGVCMCACVSVCCVVLCETAQ